MGYELAATTRVVIKIYNIAGQLVRKLADRTDSAGSHLITWNGLDEYRESVPSGCYLCSLDAEGKHIVRKMTFVK
jgi:flagellar hook assembly protein FlgD